MRITWTTVAAMAAASWTFSSEGSSTLTDLALQQTNATARPGLCLVLGARDAGALAKLATGSRLQVQGVVTDRVRAEHLRAGLPADATGDRLSVAWRRTPHLPYLDSLANLIVAEGWGSGDLQALPLSEIVRVLCPGGTAIIGSDAGLNPAALLAEAGRGKLARAEALQRPGAWIRIVKQFDPAFGRLAGGDAEGLDQIVAPNKEVRWVNTPLWGNSWDGYSGTGSYGCEIFAGGRTFHTEIDWIRPGSNQYSVVARDAFNGMVLWRENIADRSRVAGADETRVYLFEGKELVARDSATGKVINNYGGLQGQLQILGDKLATSVYHPLTVFDRATGKTLWSRPWQHLFPPAARGDILFIPGSTVEAVNVADGKTVWKAAPKELADAGGKVVSIACKTDTLYIAFECTANSNNVTRLVAMDAANGNVRWSDVRPRHHALVMPFADQVWYARVMKVKGEKGEREDYEFIALDSQTGKEIKKIGTPKGGGCWGVRASDRYLIWSRSSFLDRKTFEISEQFGVRSSCRIGPKPAYGLVYHEPHTCNCYVALRGVYALSGGSHLPKGEAAPRLIKGPGAAVPGAPAGTNDWPVYRGSGARGNAFAGALPAPLKKLWSAKLGGAGIPQATGAGGLVFVAVAEQHRVVALDVATGAQKWSFPAEGRVSMAPTYHNGLLLVGDHAGWVYALEAASGKLIWQLQAAPEQKIMSAYGQFESSWPVKSGVLVFDDKAYFVAGRCGTMDGGIHLYGVDPGTGAVQMKTNFNDNTGWVRSPKTADLLVSDGRNLIGWGIGLATATNPTPAQPQRTLKFGATWQGPNAVLDMLATMNPAGTYMKSVPSDGRAGGETICFDSDRTITTGRELDGRKQKEAGFGRCHVACTQGGKKSTVAWTNKDTKLQMRALLLAGARVYAAGIPEFQDPQEKPALVILAAADGQELQRLPLESAPALDGLSAVSGKLILTTTDGRVQCYEKQE